MAPPGDSPDRPAEEERLIRAAQKGDRPAFAALVESYWDRLYRWLYHLGRDRHAAEDLAQETFLKAFAGLHRFRAGTNFAAWLFRIAHNNFANQRRAAARRPEALPDDVAADDAGPAEEAESREAVEGVACALSRLPPEYRAALLLRAEQGLSFREIAGVLELTEETARWRVFKARQKLLSPARRPTGTGEAMNCDAARRLLLAEEHPERPSEDDVRRHLAACSSCRAWGRRLTLVERQVARLPVPPSSARPAFVRRFLETGGPVVRRVPLPWTTPPKERGLQKLSLAVAIAAVLAVFTLGWWTWPRVPAPRRRVRRRHGSLKSTTNATRFGSWLSRATA